MLCSRKFRELHLPTLRGTFRVFPVPSQPPVMLLLLLQLSDWGRLVRELRSQNGAKPVLLGVITHPTPHLSLLCYGGDTRMQWN